MGLTRVQDYQYDQKTRTYTLGVVKPQFTFVQAQTLGVHPNDKPNPDYHPRITWQAGTYYTGDGPDAQEYPEEQVPEYIKTVIAASTSRIAALSTEQVMRTCPVCEEPTSSADWDDHLVAHARRQSPDGRIDPERLIPVRRPRGRPRKHPRPEAVAEG